MKKLTNEEVINRSNKIHNYLYDYSLVDYINIKEKVNIICKKHGVFKQRMNEHLIGQGCPECKKDKLSKKKYTTEEIIKMFNNIHGDLYDYSLSIYNGTENKIDIICKKHGIFKQTPHGHLRGNGCPLCKKEKFSNIKRFNNEQITNIFINIHNEYYDYSLIKYKNNKTPIEIICPIHGIFKQKPIIHLTGSGCPKCSVSKGEKKIIQYLNENKIKYTHQKTFENCKYKNKLRFDFYIPEYNLAIEYDGEQHFNCNEYFGGVEEFEKTIIKDNIKNEFCNNNNISLLRITYKQIEQIELILNKQLKENNYE